MEWAVSKSEREEPAGKSDQATGHEEGGAWDKAHESACREVLCFLFSLDFDTGQGYEDKEGFSLSFFVLCRVGLRNFLVSLKTNWPRHQSWCLRCVPTCRCVLARMPLAHGIWKFRGDQEGAEGGRPWGREVAQGWCWGLHYVKWPSGRCVYTLSSDVSRLKQSLTDLQKRNPKQKSVK